ncbi:MAG: hypothetical protein IPQ13_09475 [Holophagaceae bacterium]|nr:hypothetical protein [Holophagaceae bacterium]
MHRTIILASALVSLGCTQIRSVATIQARIPKNSGITLIHLGPDPAGVEHAISSELLRAGYQPFSGAIRTLMVTQPTGEAANKDQQKEQEITRKYQTAYLCQVKTNGVGTFLSGFSLQLIEVASGKILVSINGNNGNYTGEEVAKALVEQLSRISG